jgi:choline dehydrogenase
MEPTAFANDEIIADKFDYIVIGGGTAGCVVAARLAEDERTKVLLIERGHDHEDDNRLHPVDLNTVMPKVTVNEMPVEIIYSREKYLSSRINEIYVPRVLGGGPAISASFWGRGDPSNYDEWEGMGNKGWNYSSLLPFFKKSETFYGVMNGISPEINANNSRGYNGPINVISHDLSADAQLQPLLNSACDIFGINLIQDSNLPSGLEGISPMQRSFKILNHQGSTIKYARSTTYIDYIKKYNKANLQVLAQATVIRLILSTKGDNRITAVEYLHKGKTNFVQAKKEVILSAGAINSPKILLQSGIGCADTLQRIGIRSVHNLPGVGKNLQDHVQLGFSYLLDPAKFVPRINNSPVVVNFLKTSKSNVTNIEMPWYIQAGNPCKLFGYAVLLRSSSRGSVKLEADDPLLPPLVEFNWNPYSEDCDAFIEIFQKIRKWLLDSNFANQENQPGFSELPFNATLTQWQRYLSKKMHSDYHMAGTCQMGPDSNPDAVVDAELRVKGIANLRVADCSIMPMIVANHPSCTAAMIGEKLAEMIKTSA